MEYLRCRKRRHRAPPRHASHGRRAGAAVREVRLFFGPPKTAVSFAFSKASARSGVVMDITPEIDRLPRFPRDPLFANAPGRRLKYRHKLRDDVIVQRTRKRGFLNRSNWRTLCDF